MLRKDILFRTVCRCSQSESIQFCEQEDSEQPSQSEPRHFPVNQSESRHFQPSQSQSRNFESHKDSINCRPPNGDSVWECTFNNSESEDDIYRESFNGDTRFQEVYAAAGMQNAAASMRNAAASMQNASFKQERVYDESEQKQFLYTLLGIDRISNLPDIRPWCLKYADPTSY